MVDKGSPADLGGLRTGDRIFAVNGHSIIGESHKKAIQFYDQMTVALEEQFHLIYGFFFTHLFRNKNH
ncbi:hypothetical protein COOONC_27238 [Cooperia oncophora]